MNGKILPCYFKYNVTRKLSEDELNLHNFKTYAPWPIQKSFIL